MGKWKVWENKTLCAAGSQNLVNSIWYVIGPRPQPLHRSANILQTDSGSRSDTLRCLTLGETRRAKLVRPLCPYQRPPPLGSCFLMSDFALAYKDNIFE